VCYSYGNLEIVITKCSYDGEDAINRFIRSRTHYLLATEPIYFTVYNVFESGSVIIIIIIINYKGEMILPCSVIGSN
jgi:hypothetical protein